MRQGLFSGRRWPAVSAAALVVAAVFAGPVSAAGGGKPMSLAAGDFKDPDQPGVVAVPGENQLAVTLRRTPVFFRAPYAKGTVFISTKDKFLYLYLGDNRALRYGVAVGREGMQWTADMKVTRKAEWPSWTPPKEMIAREAKKGHMLPDVMKGGKDNPLGARALYLGSSIYRIHGTNQPKSIGKAASSGCIRMLNEHVMDLYPRVPVGTRVIVS